MKDTCSLQDCTYDFETGAAEHQHCGSQSTCRDVTVDPGIQLPDCPSRARSHPHQEMLIIVHIQIGRVDSATAPELWNLIEIGRLIVAVQTVLVRRPGNVGLLQKNSTRVLQAFGK